MNHKTPPGYEEKFAGFIRACEQARAAGAQQLLIAEPWAIGDTYEEVIESLTRLADAGLALQIAGKR